MAVPLAAALAWRVKLAGKRYSSLAVLPLENLSGDAEQEWFSDGMTETLISELSKVRSLRVISRTSVMHYKKQPRPLKTVARELDVEAVVEGAAQKLGERAHITARLIDASTDRPLWSDDFDRDTGDVITLHRELARAIAREVRATLDAGEEKGLSPARKARPEAVEAYLRGAHLVNKGPNNFPEALGLAREAVRLVSLLLALVGLAGFEDYYPSEISGCMRKRAGLARAMALDPDILFFDEPSAGLDPISSKLLDDLILELRESLGTTIVVGTHELASIFAIANNSVYLDVETRTMTASGDPKKLLAESKDPTVRKFLTRGTKG